MHPNALSGQRYFAYLHRMIRIYGIKNCNSMQKAFTLLEEKKKEYEFHNYKESGIDRESLELWLTHFPTDKLINTKGTTYRALTDKEKASIGDKEKAIALMIKNPTLIKRPVWDLGRGKFYLGYDEEELPKLLK
jgi:arsenate reductase